MKFEEWETTLYHHEYEPPWSPMEREALKQAYNAGLMASSKCAKCGHYRPGARPVPSNHAIQGGCERVKGHILGARVERLFEGDCGPEARFFTPRRRWWEVWK